MTVPGIPAMFAVGVSFVEVFSSDSVQRDNIRK